MQTEPVAERADSQGKCEPDPLVDVPADPAHHIRVCTSAD